MTRETFDILVAGGGVAGLSAAIGFGAAGYKTLCIDPTPPVTERGKKGADLRTTAFLQPSRDFLNDIGLWSHVEADAAPLQVMAIVDNGTNAGPSRHAFDAREISERPFGWNVANWQMRRALLARVEELDQVTFQSGLRLAGVTPRKEENLCLLSDGRMVSVKLLVGADGRNSFVRQHFGIRATTKRFGQKAITFAVSHDVPHNNISTEVHRSGGPFTLVPLPDHEGRHTSAVVWMERGAEVARLMALSDAAFSQAASERSAGVLGPLTLDGPRGAWPIISQIAHRLYADRAALVAEAAHVVPPIGAQGLNMSLKDIATLSEIVRAVDDPGDPEGLRRYHMRRHTDMVARVAGVSALNMTSMADSAPMRAARALGLKALHEAGPIRKTLMQLGLGAR